MSIIYSPLSFQGEYARCLTVGHLDPVLWTLPDGRKKWLCHRCARTFPMHYGRLMTMPGVEIPVDRTPAA